MAMTKQQQTNNMFCDMLVGEVHEYCEYKKVEVSNEEIIRYMVSHNIIRQSMINRYMVIKLYPEYLEAYGSKMKAVTELAKILPIHEQGVYSILANHYFYFVKNKLLFP